MYRPIPRFLRAAHLAVGLLSGAGWLVAAQPDVDETAVKALFLERISRFITWPKSSPVQDSGKPFTIGVLGESPLFASNPFGSMLEQTFRERGIKNKRVKVVYFVKLREVPACDLLYLTNCRRSELGSVLSYTRGKPILTVADSPGFASAGVHINFFLDGKNLRFEINESSIRESGLVVDSLLLNSAVVVKPGEGRP